jgi:hypothetical protein
VILGIGWGWLIVYAFPGVMTMDSMDQLREGATRILRLAEKLQPAKATAGR